MSHVPNCTVRTTHSYKAYLSVNNTQVLRLKNASFMLSINYGDRHILRHLDIIYSLITEIVYADEGK